MTECIVCNKDFDETAEDAGFKFNWDGKWYNFDDIGCRNRFIGDPAKYLNPESASA